ncbi:V-type ATP synthase subunit I [Candidatus Chlamydia corallus]|uniref:V-type ATP synthase subunit I n=1 Tax=Candidatus Chlamydia corallus TaxID=2038470 RepID=UPI000C2FE7C4|nr:V-type ATP synthase subunit I [Candidatus Chlamydia corallus]
MRLDIHKYLFIGRDKADFFSASRELGVVEFISKKRFIVTQEGHRFVECLKVFDHLEAEYSLEALEFVQDEDVLAEDIVTEVLTLNKEIKGLSETVKALRKEIVRVKPLGFFSSSEITEFSKKTGISLRFFYRTHKANQDLEEDLPNVFYLSTAYNFDYYLVLGVVDLPREHYTEIEAPRSVNELQVDLASLQREIRSRVDRLCDLCAYRTKVLQGLCAYDNEKRLYEAKECCEDLFDGKVFAVTGWVIVNKIQELQSLCNRYQIYIERVPVDPDEIVPTYLENKGVGMIGEDLVQIYDTPAYSDKDPSTWVFFAFVLFFSMIVNDAGYGLLFLASSFLFSWKNRRKMKFSKHLSRIVKMTAILGLGCICWGTTTTSFFGITFSKTSMFREYSMTHILALKKAEYYLETHPKSYKELTNEYPSLKAIRDPKAFLLATETGSASIESRSIVYDKFVDNILMELALFIGVIHLSLGMLRYLRYRYAGIGWIIFMVSAYLYVPIYLGAVSLIHYLFHVPYELGGQIGYYGMFCGIGLAVVLAVIQKSWRGVEEIISVIQVFSDVLSYLRIYALGLAGAMMGATFNQMGARLPMLLGSMVILLGHSVNIILSIMGGVIHGLRLNFIEWYHYSFDGGGRPLRPLRKVVCREDAPASGIHLDNNSIV